MPDDNILYLIPQNKTSKEIDFGDIQIALNFDDVKESLFHLIEFIKKDRPNEFKNLKEHVSFNDLRCVFPGLEDDFYLYLYCLLVYPDYRKDVLIDFQLNAKHFVPDLKKFA